MNRPSTRITKRLRTTAYHEAGHAVAAWWLFLKFRYVTIKPDGDTLGHVKFNRSPKWFSPDIDKSDRVRLFAERHIISSFAGQIAEAQVPGQATALRHACR